MIYIFQNVKKDAKKFRILNSWFPGGTRQRMATFWASNLEECSALHAVHQGALQAGRTDCQRYRQGNIFICKCVDSALNPAFETVNGPDLVTLSPDVVKDLSHDQKYGYKIIKALTVFCLWKWQTVQWTNLPQLLANNSKPISSPLGLSALGNRRKPLQAERNN